MERLLSFVETLNNELVWGPPMVILMIGTGLFLTLMTGGVIFSRFAVVMRYTAKTLFQRADKPGMPAGSITPFQAVCTALAATVGTGNIVGVALAISAGGPGAMFWLWVSALVGMVIKYSEVTLSVAYREVNEKGDIVGGPMYYIRKGLGLPRLASLFSFFGFLASFGIGASVQANSLAIGAYTSFGLPRWIAGIAVSALAGMVIIGGIKRIAAVTEVLVPVMSLFYLAGAVIVLAVNREHIPSCLASIFSSAFSPTAATGGFAGASVIYACRVGMARGVFTHEAGMGSAPIAHASANNDHPARQGLWGAFEVFFDSMVMCSITGLVILTSGLWKADPLPHEGAMSSAAFEQGFTGGSYIVTVGLMLFALATIIAWYYYGEKCVEYLLPKVPAAILIYQSAYVTMVFAGCVANLDTVWAFADLFNGLMALPNLIALIGLSPVIRRLSRDFFRQPDVRRPKGMDVDRFLTFRGKENRAP